MSGFNVDAVREARKWLVERVYNGQDNFTPADGLFLSWYGHANHADFTVISAYGYYHDGNYAHLVLRSGEGTMPGDRLQPRPFHPTH